jgi:DNA-directed RNA polymerase subunit RPC12/RpoP
MREKLIRFMQGRYGMDQLSRFTTGTSLFLMVLTLFIPNRIGYTLAVLLLIYSYFRMFSKNHTKRYKENQWFLKYYNPFHRLFVSQKNILRQRKTHHIYTCPTCKQKIRIPKGKGKIQIRCPKCNAEFIKRS